MREIGACNIASDWQPRAGDGRTPFPDDRVEHGNREQGENQGARADGAETHGVKMIARRFRNHK